MELLIIIIMIIVLVFTIARIYKTKGLFGTTYEMSVSNSDPIRETNNKPIIILYNEKQIVYKNGIPYRSATNTAFDDPLKHIKIKIGNNVPYEINCKLNYSGMIVTDEPTHNGHKGDIIFRSDKTYHPGNIFKVLKPNATIMLYV